MAKPSTVNNQQSENSFCGEYKSFDIIKIANVLDLQVYILVLLLCELLERIDTIYLWMQKPKRKPSLFIYLGNGCKLHILAVIVIFIFIATLAEDI